MTSRVFLVGFMGSGKTTLGRSLAARLNYEFLDLDDRIEQQEGQSISKIFETLGEEGFRLLEKQRLRALGAVDRLVLSTGGGTPCHHDNMAWMNDHGITVYLNTPIPVLHERLRHQKQHRPLIAGMNDEALKQFIESRLSERQSFYVQSRIEMVAIQDLEHAVRHLVGILEPLLQ